MKKLDYINVRDAQVHGLVNPTFIMRGNCSLKDYSLEVEVDGKIKEAHFLPDLASDNYELTLSLNKDDMKYVTRDFYQQNKKSQLKFGDILIARHGDSGKAMNYESSEEANCLNIIVIRPDFQKCNYRYKRNRKIRSTVT